MTREIPGRLFRGLPFCPCPHPCCRWHRPGEHLVPASPSSSSVCPRPRRPLPADVLHGRDSGLALFTHQGVAGGRKPPRPPPGQPRGPLTFPPGSCPKSPWVRKSLLMDLLISCWENWPVPRGGRHRLEQAWDRVCGSWAQRPQSPSGRASWRNLQGAGPLVQKSASTEDGNGVPSQGGALLRGALRPGASPALGRTAGRAPRPENPSEESSSGSLQGCTWGLC